MYPPGGEFFPIKRDSLISMLNQVGEFVKLDRPDFVPALKLVLLASTIILEKSRSWMRWPKG